ncbi:MAG: insulinase family protein [Nitrospirae bacterium]|nr:MAG: insulinase family protein [Nitrospirota bacterium]
MRRRVLHPVFALLALIPLLATPGALAANAVDSRDPRSMTFEPVKIPTPNAERVVLDNGIVVYLLPDVELPLVTISAMIRTGSIYEPPEKIGLAELTGIVMRTGGTDRMSADQVDETLEYLAANVSIGIGLESGGATLDILKKDFPKGLAIFERQALEGIRRRNDNPAGITGREFRKLLYGPDHPFGRESTTATVSRITRDDLVAFHHTYLTPGGLMLAVSGDFDKLEMLAALRAAFGDWPAKSVSLPVIPPPTPAISNAGRSVFIVPRSLTQTHLRIGQLSVREDDPDYFALALLDDILGGNSFTSRLFRDVRNRQGLAYSVGSTIRPGHLVPGALLLHALTKAPTTYQALNSMLEQYDRLRIELVSDLELQQAKDAFLNSFVFSFADAGQIVSRLMELEYYGLPPDFLQQFRDGVVRLTKEDLLRVAQKHLNPSRLIILAVGKEEDFEKPLTAFGKVTVLSLKPGG